MPKIDLNLETKTFSYNPANQLVKRGDTVVFQTDTNGVVFTVWFTLSAGTPFEEVGIRFIKGHPAPVKVRGNADFLNYHYAVGCAMLHKERVTAALVDVFVDAGCPSIIVSGAPLLGFVSKTH